MNCFTVFSPKDKLFQDILLCFPSAGSSLICPCVHVYMPLSSQNDQQETGNLGTHAPGTPHLLVKHTVLLSFQFPEESCIS